MKSFPSYRIGVIFGWVLPPIISFFLLRRIPIHLIFKIILFPVFSILIFFAITVLAMKISTIWNDWQRRKEKKA